MHLRTHQRRPDGFTLVELLIVVAIIALLLSILLPAMSKAREMTKRARCGSNVRQVMIGNHIYAAENSDTLPRQKPSVVGFWNWFATHVVFQTPRNHLRHDGVNGPCGTQRLVYIEAITHDVLFCPSFKDTDRYMNSNGDPRHKNYNSFEDKWYNEWISYSRRIFPSEGGKPADGAQPYVRVSDVSGNSAFLADIFSSGRIRNSHVDGMNVGGIDGSSAWINDENPTYLAGPITHYAPNPQRPYDAEEYWTYLESNRQ